MRDPQWFIEYARRTGVLRTEGYPSEPTSWIHAIANLDPVAAAAQICPRPWLLMHGTADDVVPLETRARWLADAASDCVEVRIVANGAHRLRHDPRAIAGLLGWLDRQEP